MDNEAAIIGKPSGREIQDLCGEFHRFTDRRDSDAYRRDRLNHDARFCIWPGQSDDGKKWAGDRNGKVWPWKGASDARVKLIDKYIREDAATLMVIWRRMKLSVQPVEANDAESASRLTSLLRWVKYNQMTEARREARLAANWFLERGKVIIKNCWAREEQLELVTVDLEDVRNAALEAMMTLQQGQFTEELEASLVAAAEMEELILNPEREKEAIEAVLEIGPELSKDRRRRLVRDLREKGSADFPQKYLSKDRPAICTLPLNEEVFIPPEASDLESASGIFQRELITESTLRERVGSHGYDRDWVEHVATKLRGQHINLTNSLQTRTRTRRGFNLWQEQGIENLYEVVHGWARKYDDDGVPGIYYTVFSGGYDKEVATHELLNYGHGQYPFTLMQREIISRKIDDSRGIGEVSGSGQNQVKVQWDARTDRTTLVTIPPMYYPEGEEPNEWGPGARLATSRPDDFGYLKVPKWDVGSQEIEETIRSFEDEYHGRLNRDGSNEVEAGALKQELADNWLAGWQESDTQVLQLCQQFLPENTAIRVMGANKQTSTLRLNRADIQGRFDLLVDYNVDNLQPAVVKEKIGLLRDSLQLDRNGRMNPDAVLEAIWDMVDPALFERVAQPGKDATSQMRKQVRDDILQMFAGNEVDYVENDPSAPGKIEMVNEIFKENPRYQQAYGEDERFRELMDNYWKNLMHSADQLGANAFSGRTGVKKISG